MENEEHIKRAADKFCKEKACQIQYCLQAHSYQESACQAEIQALRDCCHKLKPEILKHCSHCAGVFSGKVTFTMADTEQSSPQQSPDSGGPRPQSLMSYIRSDVVATTLFSMRLVTVVCTLLYIISTLGFLGHLLYQCYLNAMLTSFFTFTIRLHQRKKQQEINLFSRQMLDLMTSEDSGHYMLYTFFYYNQLPVTIYLIPPFLYAVLFSVNYTRGLLPFFPASIQRVLTNLNTWIATKQQDIKRFIAYAEIFLMFIVIWNVLSGVMFILAPFLHYQFLRLRYCSRRNPSVRIAFSDLRMSADYVVRHPRCPALLSTIIQKITVGISALAPVEQMRREA